MGIKQSLYTVIIAVIAIIVITIVGNIIVIGEKIAIIFHTTIAEYIFYALLLCILYMKVIKPILHIYRMPEFPPLNSDLSGDDDEQVENLSKALSKNCYHLNAEDRDDLIKKLNLKEETTIDVKETIKKDLKKRSEASKSKIQWYATTVFITTSISQNGKMDSLIISLMNIRMIYEMIMATGFRPKITELIKIYKNVLSVALFSYITSEALSGVGTLAITDAPDVSTATDDMDLFGLLSKKRVKGVILSSLADGMVNTLLTCRIGYITQKYLEAGPNAFSKEQRKETRKEAIIASFGLTKDIMAETIKDVKDETKEKIAELFNKKENEIIDAIEKKTGSTMENLKSFFSLGWFKKSERVEPA